MKKKSLVLYCVTVSTLGASGFQILEQNSTFLGQAYAGSAASTENASVAYYNPASSLHLAKHGHYFSNSLAFIAPNAQYTVTESIEPDENGIPVIDDTSSTGHVKSINPIPGLMYSYKHSDNLSLNVALIAPFGLSMNYPSDSRLRYFGVESKLEAVALTPSIAVGNKTISAAFGPILAKAQIKLSQVMNIDGFAGEEHEHLFEQTANAFTHGWHVGVHYDTSRVKLGFSYKSSLDLDASGEVRTTLPTGTRYTEISANSPSYYTLSSEFKLNEKIKLLADFSRTRWSRFDVLSIELRKVFASETFTQADVIEGFVDTDRYALGVNYILSDQRLLRLGFAVDETPTTDEHRNVRIPDSTRNWYSAGVSQKTNHGTIDIGYSFVKMRDTSVDESHILGTGVKVDYKSHVHILGIQWNYNWS